MLTGCICHLSQSHLDSLDIGFLLPSQSGRGNVEAQLLRAKPGGEPDISILFSQNCGTPKPAQSVQRRGNIKELQCLDLFASLCSEGLGSALVFLSVGVDPQSHIDPGILCEFRGGHSTTS
mmetsp:Transcript_27490/g.37124  ORF Transcript_27490/g.37124 Transcript_27490/m.37124 type:complete len:121 (-) Transcript_27490:34-396(-)